MLGMRARAGVSVLAVVCAVLVAALSATSAQAFSLQKSKLIIVNQSPKTLFLEPSKTYISSRYSLFGHSLYNSAYYSSDHSPVGIIAPNQTVTICAYGRADEGLFTGTVYGDNQNHWVVIETQVNSDKNTASAKAWAEPALNGFAVAQPQTTRVDKHQLITRVTVN